MDRESYELMESAVVSCYVIPGFHTAYFLSYAGFHSAYCFPYYFKVYAHIYVYT